MLRQIRKRVQDRRQHSVEIKQVTGKSPCNSPQVTPTGELPPKFPFVRSKSYSFEEDEPLDISEIYKTPTQKAVPIDDVDMEAIDEQSIEKWRGDGRDLKSRRPSARKLRLQMPKSGNRFVRQQSAQQREENYRYFLRSNSVAINEVN